MEPSPEIGPYLRELRRLANLSLREVARRSGVSNAYLSQVERSQRKPGPDVLRRLGPVYGVSVRELLERAGHLVEAATILHEDEEVDRAYHYVLDDPRLRFGTRPQGELSVEAKRFIVRIYEQMTGRRLL